MRQRLAWGAVASTMRPLKTAGTHMYLTCGLLNRNVSNHDLYQDTVIPTSCRACSGLEWLQRQGKMRTCHFCAFTKRLMT